MTRRLFTAACLLLPWLRPKGIQWVSETIRCECRLCQLNSESSEVHFVEDDGVWIHRSKGCRWVDFAWKRAVGSRSKGWEVTVT